MPSFVWRTLSTLWGRGCGKGGLLGSRFDGRVLLELRRRSGDEEGLCSSPGRGGVAPAFLAF